MAWIHSGSHFDPDQLNLSVVGIAAQLERHFSEMHRHHMGQILFSVNQMMRITALPNVCIHLAPKQVLWIPPYVKHQVSIKEPSEYRSIYLDTEKYLQLPQRLQVFSISPLLKESLEHIASSHFDIDWQQGIHAHILGICLHELRILETKPTLLCMPQDKRVRHISEMDCVLPLKEFAHSCGASEKTIGRIFYRETGLTYQEWRQQWRLMKAQALLLTDKTQSDIAAELGFASSSAFITFFKKRLGYTPSMYAQKR